MALQIVGGKNTSAALGKSHGMAALLGLVLLFIANLFGHAGVLAWVAFFLFLGGFLGGITVIAQVFDHKPPLWFIAGHAALAGVGLILLGCVAF